MSGRRGNRGGLGRERQPRYSPRVVQNYVTPKLRKPKAKAPKQRKCGPCQVCCEVLAIDSEMGWRKHADTQCQHQCGSGCSIYKNKPRVCDTFQCAWLHGVGSFEDRPDRLGVLLDPYPACESNEAISMLAEGQYRPEVPVMILREHREGALQSLRVRKLVAFLASQMPVLVVVPNTGRGKVYGRSVPDGVVVELKELEFPGLVDPYKVP